MKKVLIWLLLLSLALTPVFSALAQTTEGGVSYKFNAATGTLAVRGGGPMPNYRQGAPWEAQKARMTSAALTGVNGISTGAFANCPALKTLYLAQVPVIISTNAFTGTEGVTTIYVTSQAEADALRALIADEPVAELADAEIVVLEADKIDKLIEDTFAAQEAPAATRSKRSSGDDDNDDDDDDAPAEIIIIRPDPRPVTPQPIEKYDDEDRLVSYTEFDPDGSRMETRFFYKPGEDTPFRTETEYYDPDGVLTDKAIDDRELDTLHGLHYNYDQDGKLASTDIRIENDSLHFVEAGTDVVNPDGSTTYNGERVYDEDEEPVKITEERSASGQTTKYIAAAPDGSRTESTYWYETPESATPAMEWTDTYDANDKWTGAKIIDYKDEIAYDYQYTYDESGKQASALITIVNSADKYSEEGKTLYNEDGSYSYTGRRTFENGNDPVDIVESGDADGNVSYSETTTGPDGSARRSTQTTEYDWEEMVIRETSRETVIGTDGKETDVSVVENTYDADEMPLSTVETVRNDDGSSTTKTTSYKYDEDGNATIDIHTAEYDENGKLVSETTEHKDSAAPQEENGESGQSNENDAASAEPADTPEAEATDDTDTPDPEANDVTEATDPVNDDPEAEAPASEPEYEQEKSEVSNPSESAVTTDTPGSEAPQIEQSREPASAPAEAPETAPEAA